MARHWIVNKKGKQTRYFWSDRHGADRTRRTVFKDTADGVKRMTGVHYNADTKELCKS